MYRLYEKYNKKKDVCMAFFVHIHGFKSSDEIGTIPKTVWILPSLHFHFNKSKFVIHFCWITLESGYEYVDFKRQDEICRIK